MIRQPVTIFEIDLPKCSRVFGSAPCTAVLSAKTPRKCFNTRATCADPANYDGSATLTLRFGHNQAGLPEDRTIFPALVSVSTSAAEINLSGIDTSMSALGKRARVTVTLSDFAYHDTLTDPYQAQRVTGAAQFDGIGYQPATRGSFWGKTFARWPYYVGKTARVRRGYVGDAIEDMATEEFVIAEWAGPDSSGRVQITAKDILDLVDNAKAVAPAVSTGKLLAAITATDGTLTLTPAGIGAEYAAIGRICIGREVMLYARSGDVMSVTRGFDGTAAAAHSALDAVQDCFVATALRPCDVVADLLINKAGIDPAYVDLTAWGAENDTWLASMRLSAVVTKPTGVSSLIGEISQLGIMVWWDATAKQIRFRPNRPLNVDETAIPLTDDANFLAGSVSVEQADAQRLTALLLYHGMIDPTGSSTDPANFSRAVAASVGDDLYNQELIKTICTRWFGATGDDGAAAEIADRLMSRFERTPEILTASLDAKDVPGLSLGSVVSADSRIFCDAWGQSAPKPMQVSALEIQEDRASITMQTWNFDGRFGFQMLDTAPDYDAASADEIEDGCFMVDDTLEFPDGSGPYIMF